MGWRAQMAKRILVVEDGGDLRAIVVIVLRQVGGYETIEAANGREAMEKAVSEKPDLILMDVDLPDISGITVAKAVKIIQKRRIFSSSLKRAGPLADGKRRPWPPE
jgi:CheY-like chemotaxis protein